MATKNLLVRGGADFSAMKKAMDRAQQQIKSFKDNISNSLKGLGALMAGIGAGLTLGAGIKDAMQFEAHMGTLNQTLGEATKGFEEWMNTVGSTLGMSKLQLAQYGNQYSLTLKGIAKDQDDLAKKTQQTLQAVAVIRSKTGMEVTEISDRMRSAMNGEADGADELGVNVRVAAIEASKAYKMMSNGQPFSELSQEMQKAIRWQHTMDSVTQNLGNTMANNTALKMGVFQSSLLDMRMAMGQAWLPILNIALPALTKLSNALTRAFTTFAQFMSALFGYEADTGGSLGAQTDAADSLGDSVAGVGDAYKKAGKEAKKAQGTLAGFDEVNTLSKASESSVGNAETETGAGGGTGIFDPSGEAGKLGVISEKIKEFANKVKAYLKPVGELFKKVWTIIADYFKEKVEGMIVFWNKYGKQFLEAMSNIWKGIKPIVLWIVDFIWETIKNVIDSVIRIFEGLIKFIAGAFTGDWKTAWSGIKDIFIGALNLVIEFCKLGFLKKIGSFLITLIKKFGDDFITIGKKMKEPFEKIGDWFKTKFDEVWSRIKLAFKDVGTWFRTKFDEAWTGIKTVFTNVGTWFTTNLVNPIKTAITNGKVGISAEAGKVWDGIKSKFEGVYVWFKTNVVDKIRGAFDNITSGLGSAITSGFKIVFNKAAGFINGIIDLLNSVIKKMNGLPGISGIPTITTKIPKLARGGIVNGATNMGNYIAGEAGSEMIVPLENTGFVEKLASALGTAVMNAMSNSNGSGDIVLKLNEIELGRASAKGINKAQRTAGRLLLDI